MGHAKRGDPCLFRVWVSLLALAALGCGSATGPTVLARGTLGYAAACDGATLVTIELALRFELVVRAWADSRARERLRVDLGAPEADVMALALAPGEALVGGRDGWVRALALDDGHERARWPHGAPITALAADAERVVIGDATGVVCVRRRVDGALLVCADVAGPVVRLALTAEVLWLDGGGAPSAWRLTDLAPLSSAASLAPWQQLALRVDGATVRWRDATGREHALAFGGAVRSVAPAPGGRWLVAAWVTALDQPSVVLIAP